MLQGVSGVSMVERPDDAELLICDVRGISGEAAISSHIGSGRRLVVIGDTAQEAVQAYEWGAADFIKHPVSLERLKKAVMRGVRPFVAQANGHPGRPGNNAGVLKLKSGKQVVELSTEQIQLAQGMGNYVKLYLAEGNLIVSETMTHLEDLLPKEKFIRIHRSYIVSINGVNSIGSRSVEWRGRELPLGAYYKKNALRIISTHTDKV